MHCSVNSCACTFDQASPRRRKHRPNQISRLEERAARYERLLRAFARQHKLALCSEEGHLLEKELLKLEKVLDLSECQMIVSPDGSSTPAQSSNTQVLAPTKQLKNMIDGIDELHVNVHGQLEYRGDSSGTRFVDSIRSRILSEQGLATHHTYESGESVQRNLRARGKIHQGDRTQGEKNLADGVNGQIELSETHILAEDVGLPSQESARVLVKSCFDHAMAALPFLHEPTFYQDMEALYIKVEANENVEEEPFLPVIFATLAVGCIFTKDVGDEFKIEDPKLRAFQYFRASKRQSDPASRANYFVLQTLLCQSLFLHSTADMSVCWSHIGLALKCAQRMGIQRDLGRAFPPRERQLRKKLFWILRNLDMYLHAMLGLPCGLGEEDYDQTPVEEVEDDFLLDDDLVDAQPADASSIYHATNQFSKLMTILGHIVRQVYPIGRQHSRAIISHQTIDSLEQELSTWYNGLPRHTREEEEASRLGHMHWRSTTLIHSSYHHTQFLLYRPFLHYIADSGRLQQQSYALCCRQAAFAILNLTTLVLSKEPQLIGQILALHATFLAGLILFYCLIQQKPEEVADDREACLMLGNIAIHAMLICSPYSPSAERCLGILEQVKEQIPVHSARKLKQKEHVDDSGTSRLGPGRSIQQERGNHATRGNGGGLSAITSSKSSTSAKTNSNPGAQHIFFERSLNNENFLSLAGAMSSLDPLFNSSLATGVLSEQQIRPSIQAQLNPSISVLQPEQQMTQDQHITNARNQPVSMELDELAFARLDHSLDDSGAQMMSTPLTSISNGISYQLHSSSRDHFVQQQWLPCTGMDKTAYEQHWQHFNVQPASQQNLNLQGEQWNEQEWVQQDHQQRSLY